MTQPPGSRSRFGMRFKACAFVIMIVAVALGLASAAMILETQARLREDRQQTAQSLAKSLAHSSELALAVGDTRELSRLASVFVESQGALLVDVRNAQGVTVARSGRPGDNWETLAQSAASLGHFEAAEVVSIMPGELEVGEEGFDDVPMDDATPTVTGEVRITISGAPTNQKIAEYRSRSLLIVALTSLVLLPIILWGVGLWIGRLERVVTASERIAHGDLTSALPEAAGDEIGRLCRSYESMRTALLERDHQMRAFNDTLQQQVVERTRDIVVQRDRAEEASRAKSEFLANISHELRTPMHGILSFATFGIKKVSESDHPKLLGYFQKIERSGGVLLHLLNNLLDLSKLDARGVQLQRGQHQVQALLTSVVAEFESLLQTRHIRIEANCPERLDATLDSVRIRQVVRNLLSNALRFSPDAGVIKLDAIEHDGRLRISVQDQGVGVPESELGVVFDAFVQSSLTNTGAGGTGLGLSISREIIELHGGTIWAENGVHGGAVFVFEVPMEASETGCAAVPASGCVSQQEVC